MRLSLACALILDKHNRCLLVRKRNTTAFMQAGGKIEKSEEPRRALQRELIEELNLETDWSQYQSIGSFTIPAANEEDTIIEAELYLLQLEDDGSFIQPCAELEEIIWLHPGGQVPEKLAPLTSEHVLPIWRDHHMNAS